MRFRKSHFYTMLTVGLLVGGFFLIGNTASAQLDTGLAGLDTGLGQQDIKVIIAGIIRTLLGFLGIVSVIMMIYGGFKWMFAAGREEKIQKAQRTIINAVIGLVIILSALAITQFILNTLISATNVTGTVDNSGTVNDNNGSTPFGTGFAVTSISPSGQIPIRNAVVQVALSSNIDVSTVAGNITVRPIGSPVPEPGNVSVNGSIITFTPSTPCPAPNSGEGCFDYDDVSEQGVPYEIILGSGLTGTNGRMLDCGFSSCSGGFITGALVDVTPPSVLITVPSFGASISQNPDMTIIVQASDDSGISLVEGTVDGSLIGTDAPTPSEAVFVANMSWVTSGLVAQSEHIVGAIATDLSGRTTSASDVTVIVRPEHCFDTEINFGETGLNCGGDALSAEYCGACESDACTTDAQCSAGLSCIDGSCALLPEIVYIEPTDGAPGNYITITGVNLGNATGTVRFLGDPADPADDLVAGLACANSWSDTEVIVAVPDPASIETLVADYAIGPIEIEIFNGQTDRTDDANGTVLPNFEINDTQRPGLCSVLPIQATSGDVVELTGTNLGDGTGSAVFFSEVPVSIMSNWTNTGVSVTVPPITLDPFMKLIKVQVGSTHSNGISFGINPPDLGPEPTIQYTDATSAPSGSTITIFGSNFGFQEGTVVFTDPVSGKIAHGSNDFPEECAGSTWNPDSITIIVPDEFLVPDPAVPFPIGDFNINILRTDDQVSEAVGFTITSGVPGPGICRVTPVSGPDGAVVDIYGRDFGVVSERVAFTGADSTNVTLWGDEHIRATVPEDATTGPLSVFASTIGSNSVPFEVGACTVSPDSCSTLSRCCASTLSCTVLADACEFTPPSSNYLFEWVTGPIPVVPRVLARCDDFGITNRVVSPAPFGQRAGGNQVCTNAAINATFSVDVLNLDANNILVDKCSNEECTSLDGRITATSITAQADRFQFIPSAPLEASTKYQVTITTGVIAEGEGGEPLAEDYVWTFTTRDDPEPCAYEGVDVLPGSKTLTETGDGNTDNADNGDVLLLSAPYGSDKCVYLAPDVHDNLAWSTFNNEGLGGPAVDLIPVSMSPQSQVVKAVREALNSVVGVFATYVDQGVSGFSLISVDFTDPIVQNYWPNCNEACINAQIGAQFNTAMDDTSLSTSSVRLIECENELCIGGQAVAVNVPVLTDSGREQIISLPIGQTFNTGSFYRVIIDGSVTSSSGVPLTGLNYGNAFSWVFRVSQDGNLCTVDRVDVEPRFTTLFAIGERQQFTATPFGPPDACSQGGQRLNRANYDWTWGSSNIRTAFLVGDGELNVGSKPQCNGSCVLTGSESGISVCGNGNACATNADCSATSECVNGSCIEPGEQCDFGKTCGDLVTSCSTDLECSGIGDGSCQNRAGDGCSLTCVWEGTPECTVSECSDTGTTCSTATDCQFTAENICGTDSLCTESSNSCTTDADCPLNGGSCDLTGSDCCGNGVFDVFEECDDGDIVPGDGCSATCTNEGSSAIGSVCGNGDVANSTTFGGEECDDGNVQSGDGCSSQCLWEGSRSDNPPVCGNGIMELGEECDDGNTTLNDGCTDRCLFDGGVSCDAPGVTGACCGDGTTDITNYEQCDGEEGCSDSCLLLGSSIFYANSSICGDGLADAGEAFVCEDGIIPSNSSVDGVQYAEVSEDLAFQPLPSNGLYSTVINGDVGVVPEISDDAELNVDCSCTASSECPTGGLEFACGVTSGCCAPRPTSPSFSPLGGDECRNTEVRVIFDGFIDPESLFAPDVDMGTEIIAGPANILLYNRSLGSSDPAECAALEGHIYIANNNVDVEFLPQFANNWLSNLLNWVRPQATAIKSGCYMEATPVAYDVLDHTEVVLSYNGALAANSTYKIYVMGDSHPLDSQEVGVRSITGAGFRTISSNSIAYSSSFTTGSEICKLDVLSVRDNTGNGYFASANESHEFEATAFSRRSSGLSVIQPVSSYGWSIDWSIPPDTSIVSLDDAIGNTENVQSLETSGQEFVSAIATITADDLFSPRTIGRQVTTSERASVYICEVPWPDDTSIAGFLESPLQDIEGNSSNLNTGANPRYTNFSTMYCRAEVAPVTSRLGIPTANAQVGELPDFVVVEPSTTYAPNVIREILLRNPDAPEAIGIRVLENTDSLPLEIWYAQQGFTGSPSQTTVDGFSALSDGRTIYVNGSNVNENGDIEQLIYAISYSEGAGPETLDIYNQIINNWSFNAGQTPTYAISNVQLCLRSDGTIAGRPEGGNYSCTADIDCINQTQDLGATCDAEVDKIRRDIKRIEDFRVIEQVVSNYGETKRHCSATTNLVCLDDNNCPGDETCKAGVPLLDAGTFIRGWTTSAWPSWNAEFGNELASGLPTDPLNRFSQCPPKECSTSLQACVVSSDCPDAGNGETCEIAGNFDADTCWDGNSSLFQCPAGSHVYRYQRTGIENYTLAVDLETTVLDFEWANDVSPLTDNANIIFGGYTPAGFFAVADSCTGSQNYGAVEVCGDGVIGGEEVCEIGQTSSIACASVDEDGNPYQGVQVTTCISSGSDECSGFEALTDACVPFACGNGVIEGRCTTSPNVACLSDSICGTGGTCNFDDGEVCDDGDLNGTYGFCGTDCTYDASTTLRCGNGVEEGGETCDDGPANGVYNALGNGCSWNCTGLQPRYGDGIVNGPEVCDTEFETSIGPFDSGEESCVQQGFCVGGSNDGNVCSDVDDCPTDPAVGLATTCTLFDTFRSRSCISPGIWGDWSGSTNSNTCSQRGSCRNGIEDLGEECDDGNDNNTDSCTNICKDNVCGDGFLNPALESCDLGPNNGDECTPGYNGTCNYCTTECTYQTVTGGYCGDGEVTGGELCDGSPPLSWVGTVVNANNGEVFGSCSTLLETDSDSNGRNIQCRPIGACNGGSDNGNICVPSIADGSYIVEQCADNAECVTQICDAGCGSSCPFNYQSMFIQATEDEVIGAGPTDSVRLFSSSSAGTCVASSDAYQGILCHNDSMCGSGGTCEYTSIPNSATITVPECSVASSLRADVTFDYDYKPLDVVFVLDFSDAMNNGFDSANPGAGPSRRDIMENVLRENVSRLYDEYIGPVRVGFVRMTNGYDLDEVVETTGDWQDISTDGSPHDSYNSLWGPDNCTEPYKDSSSDRYSYNLPADWQDIVGDANEVTGINQDVAACILLWPDNNEPDSSGNRVVDDFLANDLSLIPPGGWNANAAGLNRAMFMLQQFPADHERVIVHVTEGIPGCKYDDTNASGTATSPLSATSDDCEKASRRIFGYSASIKNQGMKLYTATIRPDTEAQDMNIARGYRILSSDCPVREYYGVFGPSAAADGLDTVNIMTQPTSANADFTDIGIWFGVESISPYNTGTTGIFDLGRYSDEKCLNPPRYSYISDTQSGIERMFDGIIDGLLGTSIKLTEFGVAPTSSSASVIPGTGISVPLPPGFVCTPGPNGSQEVEISADFAGDGTVTIGNFRFLSCSE